MTKINTTLIDRLVAAGGMVMTKQAPQPTRSWHDDPDDRDREIRQYEPDDADYWYRYNIFFNSKTPVLAGIRFYDLASIHYDALYNCWSSEPSVHARDVIAAVRARLEA